MALDPQVLEAELVRTMRAFGVPGAAVGVLEEGRETCAYAGITSVENPLAVDGRTLFAFGSIGKTYTAVALLRLVMAGKVKLGKPVRTYIADFRLRDEDTAARVSVLQLLNHTTPWPGDLEIDTGEGDDALRRFVERLADQPLAFPLGSEMSYNNTALSVAGRVIECVTGQTYEQAMRELVLAPLGMTQTLFFPGEAMTRRVAVGHDWARDTGARVARPWAMIRKGNAAGGLAAPLGELLAWARFHLGDGRAPSGERILDEELLRGMRSPTFLCPGASVGDACGITWWLRRVGPYDTFGHTGSVIGQEAAMLIVPERRFAFVSVTNSSPNGTRFNEAMRATLLDACLGVREAEPALERRADAALAAFAGDYGVGNMVATVAPDGRGGLSLSTRQRGDGPVGAPSPGEQAPGEPPLPLALVAGDGDRYVVTDGDLKGLRGYFRRDAQGRVWALEFQARLATRSVGS